MAGGKGHYALIDLSAHHPPFSIRHAGQKKKPNLRSEKKIIKKKIIKLNGADSTLMCASSIKSPGRRKEERREKKKINGAAGVKKKKDKR